MQLKGKESLPSFELTNEARQNMIEAAQLFRDPFVAVANSSAFGRSSRLLFSPVSLN